MPRLVKERSKKSGLPPGTLVHIGEKKSGKTNITIINYDENTFQEIKPNTIEECFVFKNTPATTWINVDGIHNIEIVRKLGECYGLHPLVLEDILNTDQRPKLEDYDGYLYIVLKMLIPGKDATIATEQISLILAENLVISFQEGIEGDVFNPIRGETQKWQGQAEKHVC